MRGMPEVQTNPRPSKTSSAGKGQGASGLQSKSLPSIARRKVRREVGTRSTWSQDFGTTLGAVGTEADNQGWQVDPVTGRTPADDGYEAMCPRSSRQRSSHSDRICPMDKRERDLLLRPGNILYLKSLAQKESCILI